MTDEERNKFKAAEAASWQAKRDAYNATAVPENSETLNQIAKDNARINKPKVRSGTFTHADVDRYTDEYVANVKSQWKDVSNKVMNDTSVPDAVSRKQQYGVMCKKMLYKKK